MVNLDNMHEWHPWRTDKLKSWSLFKIYFNAWKSKFSEKQTYFQTTIIVCDVKENNKDVDSL